VGELGFPPLFGWEGGVGSGGAGGEGGGGGGGEGGGGREIGEVTTRWFTGFPHKLQP